MRGITRNIAILLVLSALAVTGVARSAEATRGGAVGAAAAKMSRGAQIRASRMKQKMALRTRGALQQKSKRQLRLSKRQMMRAMSRREVGLHGSEAERTRNRFARDGVGGPARSDNHQEEEILASLKQQKKMRDRAKRRAIKAFKKQRRRDK